MPDAILAINTGSSSIKFAVFACLSHTQLAPYVRGRITRLGAKATFFAQFESEDTSSHREVSLGNADHEQAIQYLLQWLENSLQDLELIGAGHRVVHGGAQFTAAQAVNDQVLESLRGLIPLAPLHQPHGLKAIEALMRQQPDLPQVACFDTAFHADMPMREMHFGLPRKFTDQGIRRYGFHGLSYAYISEVLEIRESRAAQGRIVIAHLGHGASMCALKNGRSVATTMSFTPLDGLPMGTRSGSLDPAVVLYLLQQGYTGDQVSHILHHESGLLGISGISDDMQILLDVNTPEAQEAIDYFCYRVSRELGSLVAALQGLDMLVFTGGIGEHASRVRARICQLSDWLGIRLDDAANQANLEDIAASDSRVAVRVIATDEERKIAQETLSALRSH